MPAGSLHLPVINSSSVVKSIATLTIMELTTRFSVESSSNTKVHLSHSHPHPHRFRRLFMLFLSLTVFLQPTSHFLIVPCYTELQPSPSQLREALIIWRQCSSIGELHRCKAWKKVDAAGTPLVSMGAGGESHRSSHTGQPK